MVESVVTLLRKATPRQGLLAAKDLEMKVFLIYWTVNVEVVGEFSLFAASYHRAVMAWWHAALRGGRARVTHLERSVTAKKKSFREAGRCFLADKSNVRWSTHLHLGVCNKTKGKGGRLRG